jgi:hypothetical protein
LVRLARDLHEGDAEAPIRMNLRFVTGNALLLTALAAPTLQASTIAPPGMVAYYPNYNQGLNSPTNPNVQTHNQACYNDPSSMPSGRQTACGQPQLMPLSTGRWQITVANAGPFPTSLGNSGYGVFVSTVGGNAHCFEEALSVSSSHQLSSTIRCVSPSTGSNVDSKWAWYYRADSLDYPQQGGNYWSNNFAYARINANGTVQQSQSLNNMAMRTNDVLVTRNSVGNYTVTFKDLNPADGGLDPTFSPYNVVVQKTCLNDSTSGSSSSGCYRAVCIPYTWDAGDFDTWDTTVNVRCYGQNGSLRDTGFRLFFGDEAFNSQEGVDGGMHFGWANWSLSASAPGCYTSPIVIFQNQHQVQIYPSGGAELCRESTGQYRVDFPDLQPYAIDDFTPIVSSRATGGTYCNAESVACAADRSTCGLVNGPPSTRVRIKCYNRFGNVTNAQWNMNMVY